MIRHDNSTHMVIATDSNFAFKSAAKLLQIILQFSLFVITLFNGTVAKPTTYGLAIIPYD